MKKIINFITSLKIRYLFYIALFTFLFLNLSDYCCPISIESKLYNIINILFLALCLVPIFIFSILFIFQIIYFIINKNFLEFTKGLKNDLQIIYKNKKIRIIVGILLLFLIPTLLFYTIFGFPILILIAIILFYLSYKLLYDNIIGINDRKKKIIFFVSMLVILVLILFYMASNLTIGH